MFDSCTAVHLARFAATPPEAPATYAITALPPTALGLPLQDAEWELSAIDFHCSDIDQRLAVACGAALACRASASD